MSNPMVRPARPETKMNLVGVSVYGVDLAVMLAKLLEAHGYINEEPADLSELLAAGDAAVGTLRGLGQRSPQEILEFLAGAGFEQSKTSVPHDDQTVYLLDDGRGNSLQFNYAPHGLPGLPAWKFCAYKVVNGELQHLPMGGAVTPHDIMEMVTQFAVKPQDAPRP